MADLVERLVLLQAQGHVVHEAHVVTLRQPVGLGG
jgi:hypothetical protein